MNDANIEHLLRGLKPVQPSAQLTERVAQDLALAAMFRDAAEQAEPLPASQRVKPMTWASASFWAGLGAAAAVIVMLAMPSRSVSSGDALTATTKSTPAAQASSSGLTPAVSTSRELVDVQDEGIHFSSPDQPQRQMRVRSVERRTWVDPRDGAEYIIEVPHEESLSLPLKLQ